MQIPGCASLISMRPRLHNPEIATDIHTWKLDRIVRNELADHCDCHNATNEGDDGTKRDKFNKFAVRILGIVDNC
jgi:hypothetical protein